MLCEKCGKNNPAGAEKCLICGAGMPSREGCGGFGDVLSYEKSNSQEVNIIGSKENAMTDNSETPKLTKKVNKLVKNNKKMMLIMLAAVLIGLVSLSLSLYYGISAGNKISILQKDISALQDEITEIKPKQIVADSFVASSVDNSGLVQYIKGYYNLDKGE